MKISFTYLHYSGIHCSFPGKKHPVCTFFHPYISPFYSPIELHKILQTCIPCRYSTRPYKDPFLELILLSHQSINVFSDFNIHNQYLFLSEFLEEKSAGKIAIVLRASESGIEEEITPKTS
ncbi:MAG: hypothetical protein ACI8RD_009424 [Bacillariaceae sp.]|jgi:hypothetical protein